jgi:UDP-glucose 4-epimerase
MKVLITGATGRIGSGLAERLIGRGDQVRTLVLPDDPNLESARRMGIECVPGSLTNFADVLPAVEGVDAVVHLAAVVLFDEQSSDCHPTTWEVNIQSTYYVFEAANNGLFYCT